jgi:serine/threonine protein phosphatase 1
MRILALGDIHGCFRALNTLVSYVPIRPDDLIVGLGDYVNRGPNSCAVLDWLAARKKAGGLVALRGNHEIMMLEARDNEAAVESWLSVGGNATLASYSYFGDRGQLIDVYDEHWDFLEQTVPYYETATHFFVHANALPEVPLAEQPDYVLYWEQFNDPPAHESGKVMVCGHTSQKSGVPRNVGHAICIDTRAYGGGWLTCLDVGMGKYWQANERGETRTDWLEEQ